MKEIDFNKTIYDLAMTVPEFLDIMETVGFGGMKHCVVENPNTKILTPKDAIRNHQVDIQGVVQAFEKQGFSVLNAE